MERGFRFLKDPMFYAESLYLKSPKRIIWVFMVFEDVLLLYFNELGVARRVPTNLREEHRIVLKCLGPVYEKMYSLRL